MSDGPILTHRCPFCGTAFKNPDAETCPKCGYGLVSYRVVKRSEGEDTDPSESRENGS